MLIQPSVHTWLLRARISRINTQHANNTQQGATANVELEHIRQPIRQPIRQLIRQPIRQTIGCRVRKL